MSSKTKITMSRGGTDEHELPVSEIKIPDLWHIASALRCDKRIDSGSKSAGMVLKCWGIAHDLKNHIISQPD